MAGTAAKTAPSIQAYRSGTAPVLVMTADGAKPPDAALNAAAASRSSHVLR